VNNLPSAPDKYDATNEQSTRNRLQEADDQNWKRRAVVRPVRFELQDTVTGQFYVITIASGAWVLTPIA
jgi:hypothetical protein